MLNNVGSIREPLLKSRLFRGSLNLIAPSDCSYWVAGYDVGGSIASELSAKLVDTGKVVYCYTFGAFNTRESLDTKNEIKNLRNEDDFMIKYIKGTKSGQNYGASIFENLMFEYRDLTGSSNYEGSYIFTNFLLKVYDETKFLQVNNVSDADRIITDYFRTFNKITNQNDIENYADLTMLLNKWKQGNEQAHSIKSYYVLAKSLNGFDILDWEKQEHYTRVVMLEAPPSDNIVTGFTNSESLLLEVIENVGVWYINHVSTHDKLASTNASDVATTYFTKKEHIPVDDTGTSLTEIDGEKTILTNRGGESSGKYYYFYPPFKDYETSSSMEYISNGTNRNYLKHYLGDDCSGFVQGIIYTLSDGDRGQSGNNPNVMSDTTGLWNHNVSANNLVTGEYDTDNAMLKLGWEKYYLDGNTWKQKRLFNNEVQVRTLQNVMGNTDYEMSVDFLEHGDILVTKGEIFSSDEDYDNENQHLKNKGHAEVYIGYDYKNKKFYREPLKRSILKNLFFENATNLGVPAGTITRKSQNIDFFEVPYNKYDNDGNIIQQSNSEKEKNGIEILGAKVNVGNGRRTFGWGQVKYRFPQIIHFKGTSKKEHF